MSVFRPFRTPLMRRSVMVTGAAVKAITLASLFTEPAFAQQEQRVNIAKIGGNNPVPALCDNSTGVLSTVINLASTQVQVVASTVSSVNVYICGWSFTTGSSNEMTISFLQGTSTDCITGESTKAGPYRFSSFGGMVHANAGLPILKTDSGNSFCITAASSGGPVGGIVTYQTST